ncbi:MAG: hypothetical protein DWQ07_17565 [Chloroflexi bacterium]|nr:MAG: hypothetical protein DWQ07_17565 [Chloroflexota bacterium]
MSKTVRKIIKAVASIPNLHAAFILMEVPAELNAECRLYGNRKQLVDLNLSEKALEALGIRSAYGTDIGLVKDNENISFVYDHGNEKSVQTLTSILPHLSHIGEHADVVQTKLDEGYTLHPFIDVEADTYGVFLEEPETVTVQAVGGTWDNNDQDGGAW